MKKLVLLRHGESTWNRENRFTGWTDVPLSEQGVARGARGRPGPQTRGVRVRRGVHLGPQARDQDALDRARGDGSDVDAGASTTGA